jgi:hypothetical protein
MDGRKSDNDVKGAVEKALAQARGEGAEGAYAVAVLEGVVGLVPLLGQAVVGAVTIGGALSRLDNLLLGRVILTPSIGRVLYLILAYLSGAATTADIRVGAVTTTRRSG